MNTDTMSGQLTYFYNLLVASKPSDVNFLAPKAVVVEKSGVFLKLGQYEVSPLEFMGALLLTIVSYTIFYRIVKLIVFLLEPQPPKVIVPLEREEEEDVLTGYKKFDYSMIYSEQGKGPTEQQKVHLFDPSTLDYFGNVPAMSASQVQKIVASARVAQASWKSSSFAKRRLLMRTMQRYIAENADVCARVSSRESGICSHSHKFSSQASNFASHSLNILQEKQCLMP